MVSPQYFYQAHGLIPQSLIFPIQYSHWFLIIRQIRINFQWLRRNHMWRIWHIMPKHRDMEHIMYLRQLWRPFNSIINFTNLSMITLSPIHLGFNLPSFPTRIILFYGEHFENIKPFTLYTRLVAYPSVDLFCHSWLLQVNLITWILWGDSSIVSGSTKTLSRSNLSLPRNIPFTSHQKPTHVTHFMVLMALLRKLHNQHT